MNLHYNTFKENLELKFKVASKQLSPADWIATNTYLKGEKFSFKDHEYQIAFANDRHRLVAAEKCAQIGFTEILLRWLLCFLVQNQGSQAIFTQPTATDVGKFAKSRVDTCFESCPVIKRLGTSGIDSAQLKRIGSSFLNLSGTFGTRAAISVPSDANVYDEVNFSNPQVLNQYKSRLQHSKFKLERCISTPTAPSLGVSDLVERSDQKRVMLKCDHCGHQQTLEWPDNVFLNKDLPYNKDDFSLYTESPWNYEPYIGCIKCKKEVNRAWKYREWVAKFPERARDLETGVSGYSISQLDIATISAVEILQKSDRRLDGYATEQDFYNFVLGKSYAGGESMPVTDETRVIATHFMNVEKVTGTFIGVDLGNICHVVVIKDYWAPDLTPIIVATYRIDKVELEEKLVAIIKLYQALYTVSDAMPYTTTVEKIALSIPGRMSLCFFGGKKAYSMSKGSVQVTANKTQTIDALVEDLAVARVKVASCIKHYDEFWTQAKNLVKIKAEDEMGVLTYEYVKVNSGNDHFGYAAAYALLARRLFKELQPQGLTGLAPVSIQGVRLC